MREEFSNTNTDVVSNGNVSLRFPHSVQIANLQLPHRDMSLRDLIHHVEQASGLVVDIWWCGASTTILWGSHPILIVFRPGVVQQLQTTQDIQ